MKVKITYIILLLFSNILHAQIKIQNGTWRTNEGYGLNVNNTGMMMYEICNTTSRATLFYSYSNDTIILIDDYFSDDNIRKIDRYDLKILYLSNDTAILSPVTHLSREFFNKKDTLIFRNHSTMSIDTIGFFKIHYEEENYFDTGTFRIIIDIDWEGNFTVNRILYDYNKNLNKMEIDSVKSGCFEGKLNTQELFSLRREIYLTNYKYLNISVPDHPYHVRSKLDIFDASSLHSLRFYTSPGLCVLQGLVRTISIISLSDDLYRCR